MRIDLKDKRALVCGASGGIGLAAATELAAAGAHVTLMARDLSKLETALSQLDNSRQQKHGMLQADFSRPDEVKKVILSELERGTTFHILVNNTGGPPAGPIVKASEQEFFNALNAHLICNHILSQALIPGMQSLGYGRIINVISTSVKQPLKNLGVSNTTRGAVANWSKTLAGELAPSGITVNNVLPGATKTGRLSSIIQNKAIKTGEEIGSVEQEMLAEIPMARFGAPEEIAYAIVFLASDKAAYITGTNIVVDGGRTGNL